MMSSTATLARASAAADTSAPPINSLVVAAALAASAGLALYLAQLVNWRHALLSLVGTVAGLVLYHAAFGFTSAWRVLVSDRLSAGVRAQMVMLALGCAVFIPLLSADGPVLGQALRGSVAPLSLSVVFGAFLFGIGMQLGGGCASGTLYTAGGGNPRMFVTLAFFVVGSLLGTRHAPFWDAMPSLGPLSLLGTFGPLGALAISLAALLIVAATAARAELARHGRLSSIAAHASGRASWMSGPWPLLWGAVGLVAVNVATLLLAGRPWGVTSAFALWGAKLATLAGVDVASWPYWASPARAQSIQASVLTDVTSVMDFGIMLGALAAAGFAGAFGPSWKVPARSLAAAVVGGVLLGYGARLASGCNIGAYFSGVVSTSLHGWVWFISAFAGTILGTRLRPAFGLVVERSKSTQDGVGGIDRRAGAHPG
ncbi:MAG: YeeE/YedE family protein [Vicinamibacterales bacterium]